MRPEVNMKSVTIQRCPNCILKVILGQGIRWMCDDFHPEVLALIEQQEKERMLRDAVLTDQEEMANYDCELDV